MGEPMLTCPACKKQITRDDALSGRHIRECEACPKQGRT
jgi:hypothetical protein